MRISILLIMTLESVLNHQKPWLSRIIVGSPNETEVLKKAGEISINISRKERKPKLQDLGDYTLITGGVCHPSWRQQHRH